MNVESLIGLPFMRLPGRFPEHAVAGETHEGVKIRSGAVEMVWNDMLLVDAMNGPGTYLMGADQHAAACIEIGERLYGMTGATAVQQWVTLPRSKPQAKGAN